MLDGKSLPGDVVDNSNIRFAFEENININIYEEHEQSVDDDESWPGPVLTQGRAGCRPMNRRAGATTRAAAFPPTSYLAYLPLPPSPVRVMSSSFAPTQAELALVNALFASADPSKLGIITGDAAVKAFSGAKLQPTALGEIWAIADSDNNGFLTRKSVAMAVRLIGHVQNGQQVKESLLDTRAYFRT